MPGARPWTVLPHEPLLELAPNLWAVQGTLPRGHTPRRMVIAKRRDGRLLFYNAIPLAEPDMRTLEALGTPSFLFVPNGLHRLDIHAFKERYPGLQVLCPAPARAQVEKVVKVTGDVNDFPPDPDVSLVTVRGVKTGEAVLVVRSGESTSLGFGDLVRNLVRVPGFDGFLFKLLGSVGGPRVTAIAKAFIVQDRGAVRSHLEELASLPGLVRLLPSHGEVIDRDASAVLRQVAARLG